jgi:hypothetical protein
LLITGSLAAGGEAHGQVMAGGAGMAHLDTIDVSVGEVSRLRAFVLPGTVRLALPDGSPVDTTAVSLDYRFGHVRLVDSTLAGTLVVSYRALPYTFKSVYQRRLPQAVESVDTTGAVVLREESRDSGTADLFGNSNLRRSGSITRGIIAGNNQDTAVESGLKLELTGQVVDGVDLTAVLTDENTPILPEGTTQRINEFDRVFIEIAGKPGAVQLGDFDLSITGSEFARFDRKLQGAKVWGQVPSVSGSVFGGGDLTAAGATTRGIFRSQTLVPLEGVQGPYRLQGTSGERFIVVVPGTEVVYMDGRRLTRGETNDYVIDYATAEITFSPSQLITANKRIIVEFQYTTNQFTRTLLAASAETRFGSVAEGIPRVRVSTTFIRESDSDQFNEEFGLTSQDSLLIADSGDDPAVASGAQRVEYDPEAAYVQYVQEEVMLGDGSIDTVFVALTAAPDPDTPVFRVTFSVVGTGNGRYIRAGRSVNGILYEYVGEGRGEYEPVRVLPKPRGQQLFDLTGSVRPLQRVEVFGTWALSANDENRLSSVDKSDDDGMGYIAGALVDELPVMAGGNSLGHVSLSVRRRHTDPAFRTFNRTRPVEYGRKWNVLTRQFDVTGGVGETADEATLAWKRSSSRLSAEAGRLRLEEGFDARRAQLDVGVSEAFTPDLSYRFEWIDSEDKLFGERGRWTRGTGRIEKPLVSSRLIPAFEIEHEDRRQRGLDGDSLLAGSLAFVAYRPEIRWVEDRLELRAGLEVRDEDDALDGLLLPSARGWTAQVGTRYATGNLFTTSGDVGYRSQRFTERFRMQEGRSDARSVIVRWRGDYRPFKRAVEVSWFYDGQTQRTPKLQEIYVRTGPELGQYVWVDYNEDGAIQIDEFIQETTPNEGNYVKSFVPSDSLFSIGAVQARVRLGLDPARVWQQASSPLKRFLAKISSRTSVEVVERSRDPELANIFLLRLGGFRQPGVTVNGRLVIRQDLSLLRRSSRFGLDVSLNQVRGLSDMTAGIEDRYLSGIRFQARYRPLARLTLRIAGSSEINRIDSETFDSRRFNVRSRRIVPEVSYAAGAAVTVKGGVDVAWKDDRSRARRSTIVKVPLDVRYNQARRLQVTGRAEVAHVQLAGEAVGLAEFELTDGRGPGTSYLWSLGAQYVINRYLRSTVSYDGRAPSAAPVLHTLRMQLSAIF